MSNAPSTGRSRRQDRAKFRGEGVFGAGMGGADFEAQTSGTGRICAQTRRVNAMRPLSVSPPLTAARTLVSWSAGCSRESCTFLVPGTPAVVPDRSRRRPLGFIIGRSVLGGAGGAGDQGDGILDVPIDLDVQPSAARGLAQIPAAIWLCGNGGEGARLPISRAMRSPYFRRSISSAAKSASTVLRRFGELNWNSGRICAVAGASDRLTQTLRRPHRDEILIDWRTPWLSNSPTFPIPTTLLPTKA